MQNLIIFTALFLTLASAQRFGSTSTTTSTTTERTKYSIVFEAEEASGSGDDPSTEECKLTYIKFEQMYLRGVKEPNHKDYNATTFEECEKRCCYETAFKCRSFSYFAPTDQCFLMNVTRHDKYELVPSGSHVHVEVVKEISTTTTTTLAFPTPAWTPRKTSFTSTTTSTINTDINIGPSQGIFESVSPPDRVVAPECPKRCLNGGACMLRRTNDGLAAREAFCQCQKGYSGDQCEMEVSEAGGFPMWVIALIVLGGIILILFLTVCIMYHVYRKKTGEYKVVKAIQRWTRRGRGKKKLAQATTPNQVDDYGHAEEGAHLHHQHLHHSLHRHTSPTTSVQSIHGSVTSSTTHSTTTSV